MAPCAHPDHARGRNSVVECQLPKLDVEGSNPFARLKNILAQLPAAPRATSCNAATPNDTQRNVATPLRTTTNPAKTYDAPLFTRRTHPPLPPSAIHAQRPTTFRPQVGPQKITTRHKSLANWPPHGHFPVNWSPSWSPRDSPKTRENQTFLTIPHAAAISTLSHVDYIAITLSITPPSRAGPFGSKITVGDCYFRTRRRHIAPPQSRTAAASRRYLASLIFQTIAVVSFAFSGRIGLCSGGG